VEVGAWMGVLFDNRTVTRGSLMFWSKTKKIAERCMTADGRYLFNGAHDDSFIVICGVLEDIGFDENEYSSFKKWLDRYRFSEDFPWHQHWAEWIACMFKGCMAPSKAAMVEVSDWSTDEPNINLETYDGLLNSDLDDLWQRAFDDVESRHLLFDFVGFIMHNSDEDDPYAFGVLVDPYGELSSSGDLIDEAVTTEELSEDSLDGDIDTQTILSGSTESSTVGTTDLELELAKAKDLFDQGLIDEFEFKDLKRKILGL